MRRATTLLIAVAVTVAFAGAAPAAAPADGTVGLNYGMQEESGGNTSAPGERFSGAVSAGEAEVEGDVAAREFGVRVANADSDEERAAIVAERTDETEARLAELRERRERLRERREAGEISREEYRVRMTRLAAELGSVERAANQTAAVADDIPAETLERNGVNVSAIERLRQDASELGGGEVAGIARGIAGDGVGGAPGAPAGERGPPDNVPGGDVGEVPEDGAENGTDTPGDAPGSDGSDDGGSADHSASDDGATGDSYGDDSYDDAGSSYGDGEDATATPEDG